MKKPLDPRRIELLEDAMVEILRQKTPAERLAMGLEMNRTARLMIAAGLRDYHPDWTEQEILAELGRRMLDGTS
jgi:hypothetical protein